VPVTEEPTTTPPPLSLDPGSLGPLRLGMTLDDASATGWLATQQQTCEQVLGVADPQPGDVVILLDGAGALTPDLDATASDGGTLGMYFSEGPTAAIPAVTVCD